MYAIYAFVWQIYVPKGTYHVDLLSKHCPGPRIRQFPGIASWVASFQIVTWRVWPKDLSNVCQIVIIAVMLCPITKKKLVQVSKKTTAWPLVDLSPPCRKLLPNVRVETFQPSQKQEPFVQVVCIFRKKQSNLKIESNQNWLKWPQYRHNTNCFLVLGSCQATNAGAALGMIQFPLLKQPNKFLQVIPWRYP